MTINSDIILEAIAEAEKENGKIAKEISKHQALIIEAKGAIGKLEEEILAQKAIIESNLHDIQTANAQRYENFGTINALKKILE